jgi:hypothetical protein
LHGVSRARLSVSVTRAASRAAAAIVVAAIACGTAAVTAARAHAARPYRFLGTPLAIVGPGSDGPVFQVRLRLDRRLPVDRQGVTADVTLGGAGADAPAVPFGVRSRHCYAAVIGDDFDAPGLRGAAPGRRVRLVVRIPRVRRALVARVALRSTHAAGVARLGCGTGP